MRAELDSSGPSETLRLGRRIGARLSAGDVVALSGALGVGKTCIIQGMAQGMGIGRGEYVRSPSFIVLNIYRGNPPLYHFDLYRVESMEELEAIGYRDYLYGDGVSVIEWADRLPEVIPEQALEIEMTYTGFETRRIRFSATIPRQVEIVSSLL